MRIPIIIVVLLLIGSSVVFAQEWFEAMEASGVEAGVQVHPSISRQIPSDERGLSPKAEHVPVSSVIPDEVSGNAQGTIFDVVAINVGSNVGDGP